METATLDSVEADTYALDVLAGRAEFRLEPLHPTSQMRCALLARWLRWRAHE
ncbi:MAG: hypothetical protein JOZ19_04080 [Rubrobacter sp.]|nr:hypothetical protein [Rubrobacter sp.]